MCNCMIFLVMKYLPQTMWDYSVQLLIAHIGQAGKHWVLKCSGPQQCAQTRKIPVKIYTNENRASSIYTYAAVAHSKVHALIAMYCWYTQSTLPKSVPRRAGRSKSPYLLHRNLALCSMKCSKPPPLSSCTPLDCQFHRKCNPVSCLEWWTGPQMRPLLQVQLCMAGQWIGNQWNGQRIDHLVGMGC